MRKLFLKYGHIALSALSVMLIASMAVAQNGGNVITVMGDYIEAAGSFGAATASDGDFTRFTDVDIDNDLNVDGDTDLEATTTVQEIVFGSRFSQALTFTAAATSTPGGLFSFQNTGAPKICTTITVDVDTADATNGRLGTGHPFDFSAATSTSASLYSTKSASVIATTTLATGTAALIDSHRSPGSYIGGDQDQGSAPWIWSNAVYLLGAFDSYSGDAATSSDAYTGLAGEVHVY